MLLLQTVGPIKYNTSWFAAYLKINIQKRYWYAVITIPYVFFAMRYILGVSTLRLFQLQEM